MDFQDDVALTCVEADTEEIRPRLFHLCPHLGTGATSLNRSAKVRPLQKHPS